MNAESFGNCTNIGECSGACPKAIALGVIATMNRDYLRASWKKRDDMETTTITPVAESSMESRPKLNRKPAS